MCFCGRLDFPLLPIEFLRPVAERQADVSMEMDSRFSFPFDFSRLVEISVNLLGFFYFLFCGHFFDPGSSARRRWISLVLESNDRIGKTITQKKT